MSLLKNTLPKCTFNVELDKSYFNNASNAVLVLISMNTTECQIQTSLFDLLKVNQKEGLKIWCFCNTSIKRLIAMLDGCKSYLKNM